MSSQEVLDFFSEKRKSLIDLRFNVNKDLGDLMLVGINHRRDFYKSLAGIALAIIGLSPTLAEHIKIKVYFFISLVLFALLLIMILTFFRETVDNDEKDLQKQKDDYNTTFDEALNLIDRYINLGIYTEENLRNYLIELKNCEGSKNLEKINQRLKEERKNRNILPLSYAGELFIFLFITGSMFLSLSILVEKTLNIFILILILIILFGMSIVDTFQLVTKCISPCVHFFKKRIF